MKPLSLALLFLLAIFVSCNKSDDNATSGTPKIKTITHGIHPESDKEFYEYDSSGRIKSITYTGHEPGRTDYVYLKDKIVWKSTFFPEIDTLYLNDKGLVISEMFGSITHEYDANGYCVKTTGYGGDGLVDLEFRYKVSDENITVLDVWEIVNEKLTYRITYDYIYLTEANNTIGNENKGITFYGKQNKNLLYSSTEYYIGFNDPDRETYLYVMDAKNHVKYSERQRYPENYDIYTYY